MLVEQAAAPSELIFLTKGMCRVTKYADCGAQIRRRIEEMNHELERIAMKYTYHNSLKDCSAKGDATMTADHSTTRAGNSIPPGAFDQAMASQVTLAEQRRGELKHSIRKSERELAALAKVRARARGRSVAVASRALIRSLHSSPLSSSQAGEDKADKSLTVEVGMLMPPGICGEMGVVDPHKGIALGSVIADTMVECLVLHKVHIQTCDVTLDWLQHLRRKARIIYPEDDEIRKKTQASRIAQRQVRHAARKLQR